MTSGSGPEITDGELIARLRSGEAACANTLTERYWEAICRFCTSVLGDAALAEDVAQDTFAKLGNRDALPEGAVRPWLYKVARNQCLDIHRRHQRSPTHNRPLRTGFDAPRNTAGPRTRAVRSERHALVREIIDTMPDEYRSVLILKFFEKLGRAEIAEVLEVSEQAVKGRLARATQHLEEELRKRTELRP